MQTWVMITLADGYEGDTTEKGHTSSVPGKNWPSEQPSVALLLQYPEPRGTSHSLTRQHYYPTSDMNLSSAMIVSKGTFKQLDDVCTSRSGPLQPLGLVRPPPVMND